MITYSDNRMWGSSGGEIEYVGQRVEWDKLPDGRWVPYLVLLLTDHDQSFSDYIEPGVAYRIRMRIAE